MRRQCSLSGSSGVTRSNLFPPYVTLAAALNTSCSLLSVVIGLPASSALQLSIREATKQFTSDFAASICRLRRQLLMQGSW